MPTYRVTAIRTIEHTAILDATSPEDAEEVYEAGEYDWEDEVDLGTDRIVSVEEVD